MGSRESRVGRVEEVDWHSGMGIRVSRVDRVGRVGCVDTRRWEAG